MFGLGMGEIVLILIIALIFIGPKKLPELAKGLGKGIREFQNAAKGFSEQLEASTKNEESKQETPKIAEQSEAKAIQSEDQSDEIKKS